MNMDRAQIIRAVTQLIRQHANPKRIWLYGSQANGTAQAGSDIDIAFEDDGNPDMPVLRNAVAKLSTLTKIDLHNLSGTEERFLNRVKTTGRVLYSADKKLRAEDGLHNFSKALERFESVITRKQELLDDGYDDFYLDLAVKRFEFTYEMAWKALRRFVQYLGLDCKSPRGCITEGYAQEVITDEVVWLDMIEMRNRTSHTYDESEISDILGKLAFYLAAFTQLKDHIGETLCQREKSGKL